MHSQKINYKKNLSEIACESKHTCFYIKNYATLCPESYTDIKKIGIYCAPTAKAIEGEDNKDDICYLNRTVPIQSSPEDKSVHVTIHQENGAWKVGLIPSYSENAKLDKLYENKLDNGLLKICRATKLLLTKRKSALRICKSVLAHQEQFFQTGIDAIVPMSLLDVAFDVSLDESCVSRYSHKIILHTPHGTIKLRYLFNSQGYMGNACANYSKIAIQMKMKSIVEHESDYKKISDNGISNILKKDGIDISRRAVTKYRLEMGIPSSHARRHSCVG